MLQKIGASLFPKVDEAIQKDIDSESLKNIRYLGFYAAIAETVILIFSLVALGGDDPNKWVLAWISLFCVIICILGWLTARHLLKTDTFSHGTVTAFKVVYFLILSVWAMWSSYRQYSRGSQLLTFYAVQILMSCFLLLRPWLSSTLTAAVYVVLYLILDSIDGAAGVNPLIYTMLAMVSIISLAVRYYSQLRASEKTVQLRKSNELLMYSNRHDVLTGLRNRYALEEDARKLVGSPVSVYMVDINWFKSINDTYGHIVGDEVLKESAVQLKAMFPKGFCYRYGGDEFLVLSTQDDLFEENTSRFDSSVIKDHSILLCIGHTSGTPEDYNALFAMIAEADAQLYDTKRKTHSPGEEIR